MNPTTIIVAVLASSLLSTVVSQIGEGIRQKRSRTYAVADKENQLLKDICNGVKVILADRMEYIGKQYIAVGSISIEQRQKITEMHECYHALGGNGDFDVLLDCIAELPVK